MVLAGVAAANDPRMITATTPGSGSNSGSDSGADSGSAGTGASGALGDGHVHGTDGAKTIVNGMFILSPGTTMADVLHLA
jgi:hypothetical protein